MKIGRTRDGGLIMIEGGSAADVSAVDITGALGLTRGDPLLQLLETADAMARLAAVPIAGLPRVPLDRVDLAAPLRRPGKIVAAPVNYLDHKIEMSEQKTVREYGVFLKANSSVIGPHESVRLPYLDKRTDQEGELGIVIGREASGVTAAQALDYVFGYLPVLDMSVRSTEDRSTRKSFDTFTPLGPWVTTADEVGGAGALELRCWVGGELRQRTSTSELIFDVAELVSYASHVMTLHPGDIIASGTPSGVGPVSDGQSIVLEIEKLGRLQVAVTAEDAIPYADRPGATVMDD